MEEAGLGSCDGGDIGSGAMNIFCLVKPGRNAAKAIIEILRENNFLEGAVIAEGAVGEEKIVWPPDFKGEFQLIEPA